MTQDGAAPGSLVLSVDFPTRHGRTKRAETRVAREMLHLLHQHRINATWALDDFRDSLVPEIVSARENHEIALLGNSRELPEQRSTQVEQELARAQAEAVQIGLSIRTLAMVDQGVEEYVRLLAKYQFRMVRGRSDRPTNSLKQVEPTVLRFGLWLAPISFSLGGVERWRIRSPLDRARRAAKKVAQNGGAIHVGIDLAGLSHVGGSEWDNLGRLLADVAEDSERIESLSLQQAAVKFGCQSQESPGSRSILRAA